MSMPSIWPELEQILSVLRNRTGLTHAVRQGRQD